MGEGRFYCHLCDNRPTFTKNYNLKRHIESKHANSIFFECAECGLRFSRKDNLQEHIARRHTEQQPVFECSECGLRYSRKDNLKEHIARKHADDQPVFECAYCSKKFNAKRNLRGHITGVHEDEFGSNRPFICFHCSSAFNRSYTLRRHIRSVHSGQQQKQSRFMCLECSELCRTSKVLNKHYADVHNVVFNYEILEFDCVGSFEKWLEDHQNRHLTQFSKWYKKQNATYSRQRYMCHRSGLIRTSVTVDSRKRRLKTTGYKPLGGICPAEIRLFVRQNGTCSVTYQTTHVGHVIGDMSELKHMYLTREVKKSIAAEIQSGVPPREIVKRERLSNCGQDANRLSLITRKDIHNIAASRNLGFENDAYVSHGCDPTELMIEEHIHLVGVYPEDKQPEYIVDRLPSKDEVDVAVGYTASDEDKRSIKDDVYQNESYDAVVHDARIKQELIQQIESSYQEVKEKLATFDENKLQCIYDRMRTVVLESYTHS